MLFVQKVIVTLFTSWSARSGRPDTVETQDAVRAVSERITEKEAGATMRECSPTWPVNQGPRRVVHAVSNVRGAAAEAEGVRASG